MVTVQVPLAAVTHVLPPTKAAVAPSELVSEAVAVTPLAGAKTKLVSESFLSTVIVSTWFVPTSLTAEGEMLIRASQRANCPRAKSLS